MREILFRGKRVGNGEWVYGYYIKANCHWHKHGIHEDWIAVNTVQNGGWCNVRGKYAVIPETAGQYTGLTDKNGTKIFEGDIVNFKTTAYHFKNCRIKYQSCYGRYCAIDNKGYEYPMDKNFEYEVIGNIHDNPQLLGGE